MEVTGVVQGVGFRPLVYSLALRHGLRGWVRNTSSGVELKVEGSAEEVETFAHELPLQTPPHSHIERIATTAIAPNAHTSLTIRESLVQPGAYHRRAPHSGHTERCAIAKDLLGYRDWAVGAVHELPLHDTRCSGDSPFVLRLREANGRLMG